jgi:hypothetical protein
MIGLSHLLHTASSTPSHTNLLKLVIKCKLVGFFYVQLEPAGRELATYCQPVGHLLRCATKSYSPPPRCNHDATLMHARWLSDFKIAASLLLDCQLDQPVVLYCLTASRNKRCLQQTWHRSLRPNYKPDSEAGSGLCLTVQLWICMGFFFRGVNVHVWKAHFEKMIAPCCNSTSLQFSHFFRIGHTYCTIVFLVLKSESESDSKKL